MNISLEKEKFRKDTEEFFGLSGSFGGGRLTHYPFIVFDKKSWKKKLRDDIKHIDKYKDKWKEDMPDYYEIMMKYKKEYEEELKRGGIKICIVNNSEVLLRDFSPDTQVIAQWGGQWRSDFFQFKIKEYLDWKNK